MRRAKAGLPLGCRHRLSAQGLREAMGRRRGGAPSALAATDGVSRAPPACKRPEPILLSSPTGRDARRGHRDEPIELACGRDRPGHRAASAEEARRPRSSRIARAPVRWREEAVKAGRTIAKSWWPLKPAATASGWRAGCGHARSRPTSSIRRALLYRANTGGRRRTGWTPNCSTCLPRLAAR